MNGGRAGCQAAEGPDAAAYRTLVIKNQRGLHARAAARFVKCAEGFAAEITVTKREITVSGLSIMGLMMLAAGPGTAIEVKATGAEAQAALAALAALVEGKFGEDE
jgi:phosphocarrier protein